jgi:hypothetical protein
MSDFAQIRFQPNRPLLRELSADRLNTVLQEIRRNKPKGERGITVRQDGTGTYIGLAASLPRGGGTSTPATFHPFQITSIADPESSPESPSYLVSVRPGTLNTLLATNTFTDAALTQFPLQDNTMRNVILTAQSDGQQFVSCELSLDSTAPDPQEPAIFELPSTAKFFLGVVYNSSVYQLVRDNIAVTGKVQLTIEKQNPAQPGQLPYEIFYVWG